MCDALIDCIEQQFRITSLEIIFFEQTNIANVIVSIDCEHFLHFMNNILKNKKKYSNFNIQNNSFTFKLHFECIEQLHIPYVVDYISFKYVEPFGDVCCCYTDQSNANLCDKYNIWVEILSKMCKKINTFVCI